VKNQVVQMLIPNEPTGYKLFELSGWSGKCFIVPRTELKELESRSEAGQPGIYFLFGESDESTEQKLYIGESERFFERLKNHDAKKDFWSTAVIFTGGLDKAKVKYLEHLASAQAVVARRYAITNNVSPKENSLSEFDLTIVKDYFTKIDYILKVLGFPVFQAVAEIRADSIKYFLRSDDFDATSELLEDGSMNVLLGSRARVRETDSFWGWSVAARRQFLEDGTFRKEGNHYLFTRDVFFKSPTAAAATVAGRSINGWTAWKDDKGKTLDENLRS